MATTGNTGTRFVNVTNCTFTPASGSPVTFNGVKSIDLEYGIQQIADKGDANTYNVISSNVMNDPSITVNLRNKAQLLALSGSTYGSFTFTHLEARETPGASIVYSAANVYIDSSNGTGPHADFGNAAIVFKVVSSDGTTSPLAYSFI